MTVLYGFIIRHHVDHVVQVDEVYLQRDPSDFIKVQFCYGFQILVLMRDLIKYAATFNMIFKLYLQLIFDAN